LNADVVVISKKVLVEIVKQIGYPQAKQPEGSPYECKNLILKPSFERKPTA